jgi:hypothetical protein
VTRAMRPPRLGRSLSSLPMARSTSGIAAERRIGLGRAAGDDEAGTRTFAGVSPVVAVPAAPLLRRPRTCGRPRYRQDPRLARDGGSRSTRRR